MEIFDHGDLLPTEVASMHRRDGRRMHPATCAAISDLLMSGHVVWENNRVSLTDEGVKEALAENMRRAHGDD